jgi:hypothetical protein
MGSTATRLARDRRWICGSREEKQVKPTAGLDAVGGSHGSQARRRRSGSLCRKWQTVARGGSRWAGREAFAVVKRHLDSAVCTRSNLVGSARSGGQRDSLFLGGVLAHLAGMSSEISIYRPPILTLILQVFGTLSAVVSVVALGVIVFGLINGLGAAGTLVGLPVLVSSLVSALILFGVAQVINYLGRTAHAAEQAAAGASDSADLLRQLLRSYGHEPEA